MTSCGLALDQLATRRPWRRADRRPRAAAWTMCSIQTIEMPSRRSSCTVSTSSVDLGLGQAAGDLVEQQHARAAWRAPARARAACARAGSASAPSAFARSSSRVRSSAAQLRVTARSPTRSASAERRADEHVLEHRQAAERARDLERPADARRGSARAPASRVTSRPSKTDAPAVSAEAARDQVENASSCRPRSARRSRAPRPPRAGG